MVALRTSLLANMSRIDMELAEIAHRAGTLSKDREQTKRLLEAMPPEEPTSVEDQAA